MDSIHSKQVFARRVLLITGLFPTIPCWIVYLGSTAQADEGVILTLALLAATVLHSMIAYPFRKKNVNWIYNERPVFGSFVSMAVHMVAGFVSLVTLFSGYFLILGEVSSALTCIVYAAVAMLIALPGAIVGFYVNAHAFIYISQKSLILKTTEN